MFDVANNDLLAAASSCDANYVDRHHPLHLLVNAWEYVARSTMYGKRDGTHGVGGAGEASTRTMTKTKTAVAAPVDAPCQRRTAEGVRACIVADELYRIVCRLGDHEDGRRGGCDTDVDDDDELANIDVDRARTADQYLAATAQRTRHGPSNEDYGTLEAAQRGDKYYSSTLSKVLIISDYKSQYSSSNATGAHPPAAPPHASQLIQDTPQMDRDIRPPSQSRAKDDGEIIHPTIATLSYSCSYSFFCACTTTTHQHWASSFSPFDNGLPLLPSS